MSAEPHILVFAKEPVPGRVKTRLAASVGPERAAELYGAFLGDTVEALAAVAGARRLLYFDPPGARDYFAALVPDGDLLAQPGGDLGARLARGFARSFARGAGGVAAIGSDAPHLPVDALEAALEHLRGGRDVVGPSDDGGYWLIGLARPAPGLFEGVPWSTPDVLSATERRAAGLGRELVRVGRTFDVDDGADLERLGELLRARPELCPRTRALLLDA